MVLATIRAAIAIGGNLLETLVCRIVTGPVDGVFHNSVCPAVSKPIKPTGAEAPDAVLALALGAG